MKSFLKKSWPFLALAVLAFIIHFAFLSYPNQVVFDEVHFGKFVGAYFTGQYYFDIHPPLGKLMITGWAKLVGFNPGGFDFDHIGEQASSQMFLILRFLPVFFGALFVLAFSWLAYLISRSKTAALIAGFLILLDNAFLVQSKFILVDIFLVFFEVLTFCFFFLWQRQKSRGLKWFIYLILTSVFFGLTISVKWTGVATFGIIAVILFTKIFSKKLKSYLSNIQLTNIILKAKQQPPLNLPLLKGEKKRGLSEFIVGLLTIAIIGFVLYASFFAVHFNLLPKSGPGDAFMSWQFQQELKYGRENIYQPLSFFEKFIELNKTMYTSSAGITSEHPFGSRWYGWPFDIKKIYYWNQDEIPGSPGKIAKIYFWGNPIIWWLAGLTIICALFAASLKKCRRWLNPSFFILTLAYFANLLPFILIKRVSFLYHYLPSITFAILLLSLWLARFWPAEKKLIIFIILLAALAFLLLAPLSYGWPMPLSFFRYL